MAERDLIEFEATFGEDVVPANAPTDVIGDDIDEEPETLARPVASAETTRAIANEFSNKVDEVDLGTDVGEATVGNASASSDALAEDAPPPLPGEAATNPSTSGCVYYQGRMVLGLQRGKPKRRVTVNCYQHSRCQFLVNMERALPDDAFKRWAFEVKATPRGASTEEGQALRDCHVIVAKDGWTRPFA